MAPSEFLPLQMLLFSSIIYSALNYLILGKRIEKRSEFNIEYILISQIFGQFPQILFTIFTGDFFFFIKGATREGIILRIYTI